MIASQVLTEAGEVVRSFVEYDPKALKWIGAAGLVVGLGLTRGLCKQNPN